MAELKARPPMVDSLILGPQRNKLPVDLRERVEVCGAMSSCRYVSSDPFVRERQDVVVDPG